MPAMNTMMKITKAKSTFMKTPAENTSARLPMDLLQRAAGSSVSFTGPTSSWPSMLTYPPIGIQLRR